MNVLRLLSLILCFLFLGGGGLFVWGPSGVVGYSENANTCEIFIPKGSSLNRIAHKLVEEGVLSHPYGFMVRVFLLRVAHSLKMGEYSIPMRAPIDMIIQKMQRGDVIRRTVTLVEGATVTDFVEKLKKNPFLLGDIKTYPSEGSLLPQTYTYHRGESREDVLNRMKQAMTHTLKKLWLKRDVNIPIKTPQDALILASIVEKESSVVLEEQARIAGVFMNRLRKNMPLQSDPTVIYGITKGRGSLGRKLLRDDLKKPTPYNTYTHTGLPPTPIACPREKAIWAVLHPQRHNEIYFVANGDGGHAFSEHLSDHNHHVNRWRMYKKNAESAILSSRK